ncbi:hypothetical protein LCGC14_0142210 [marine sediment metagenome]|uniref:Uncharacterized protein n=1 Tax=marine sediment metagenome TaxID=412755 RepID=A0A0F9XIF6_9ZZZZ
MKSRKCDICNEGINSEDKGSVSFGIYDLCGNCVAMVRMATCLKCNGTGKVRVRDNDASCAQATCGENRRVSKTIDCDRC